ncbi:MAG: extracellular solute-binding protein [Anaerolineae bacterium]|nr:extracellular solute-binding protein [Anaerolineae bacterium]
MKRQGEALNGRRLTRRKFLTASGLTVVSLGASPLLSGCRPGAAPTAPAPTQAPISATPTSEPTARIGGAIQYLSWEGYDLRGCMEPWEQAHGVTMESSYIGDHPEIPAKLAVAAAGTYDLITYYHGYWQLYRDELKIITPLEKEKLPNFEDLYPFFKGHRWVDDQGTIWAVPFTFGVLGGNYNADKIKAPESWLDLLKPEFKGQFAIVDDNNAGIITGGVILGYGDKLPYLTKEELGKVMDLWKQFKANARTFAVYGDLTDLFVSGEIVASIPGWAAVNVWAQERDVNVQMYIPKEGATSFIDAYAIPPGSDNRDTVLAWINESIGPEMQACQAKALAAGVVNPKAVPLTDPAIAAMYDYNKLDEIFKIAPVFDMGPRGTTEFATYDDWVAGWEELKAS